MSKFMKNLHWFITGLPLAGIIWASFQPIQVWAHQALVLFTILWFYVFILFNVFGCK